MLPKAQIVKIDTEGSEIDILGRMTSFDFEVTLNNRRKVEELLQDFFSSAARSGVFIAAR